MDAEGICLGAIFGTHSSGRVCMRQVCNKCVTGVSSHDSLTCAKLAASSNFSAGRREHKKSDPQNIEIKMR